MNKLPTVTGLLRRDGDPQTRLSRLPEPALTPDITPFVLSWFRFRHSHGGRRQCACWICRGGT